MFNRTLVAFLELIKSIILNFNSWNRKNTNYMLTTYLAFVYKKKTMHSFFLNFELVLKT